MNKEENQTKDKINAIKSKKAVLVYFLAVWCGPCQILAPIIEEIKQKYKDNDDVLIIKVDIDKDPKTAARHQVMGVPTIVIYSNGELIEKIVGSISKEVIEEKIDRLLQ